MMSFSLIIISWLAPPNNSEFWEFMLFDEVWISVRCFGETNFCFGNFIKSGLIFKLLFWVWGLFSLRNFSDSLEKDELSSWILESELLSPFSFSSSLSSFSELEFESCYILISISNRNSLVPLYLIFFQFQVTIMIWILIKTQEYSMFVEINYYHH